jgi:transposase
MQQQTRTAERKKWSRKQRRRLMPALLERVQPDAAGIDCGAVSHFVAVPRDRDPLPVREFRTFTADLRRLADWLVQCGIKTVALESTGVYWIALYEILEERKIEVVLVNARDLRHVRGRKSDVTDAQWLQELHSVGLLRPSFRPAAEIVALRAYVRHRETLVQEAAMSIQRMHKALTQMNVQLHQALSDITGISGLAIVRDILHGVHDPQALAAHRDRRCKASAEEFAAALTGNYRPEHLFALRQNLAAYDFKQEQVAETDRAIEALLATLAAACAPPPAALPAPRARKKPSKNEPRLELRAPLHRMTGGTDLSQIDGIGPYGALQIIAEIGTDMSRWPSAGHFTSWAALAPNNRVSGGRLLSSRTPPSANRFAAIMRRAAMSLGRSDTALGAYYRRMAYRVGKAKAVTATARKLALLVYRTLRGEIVYRDPGAAAYHQQRRIRLLTELHKRARKLGFNLVDIQTGELLDQELSMKPVS